jgi:hypothetical protein
MSVEHHQKEVPDPTSLLLVPCPPSVAIYGVSMARNRLFLGMSSILWITATSSSRMPNGNHFDTYSTTTKHLGRYCKARQSKSNTCTKYASNRTFHRVQHHYSATSYIQYTSIHRLSLGPNKYPYHASSPAATLAHSIIAHSTGPPRYIYICNAAGTISIQTLQVKHLEEHPCSGLP